MNESDARIMTYAYTLERRNLIGHGNMSLLAYIKDTFL